MYMSHPFELPPVAGETVEVVPGVLWLRMPLPFALDHINLWLIEDGDGWAAVDTGIGDERTRTLWQRTFVGPMGGRGLSRLIATHFHPDHMGLAAWLGERFDVPMEATLAEWLTGRMLSLDGGETPIESSLRFYRSTGMADEFLDALAQRGNAYMKMVDTIPASFRRLSEGQELCLGGRRWRVVVGRGHSPEMACLMCEELGVFISGDQVLPAISPNVSVWGGEPEADPLSLFLASLRRFLDLPADVLVLPSHGLPFRGLHRRIDTIIDHHRERLDMTLAAAARPITAADLLKVMFTRDLDRHQLFFAIGESLAHINHLVAQGALERETGADGVHRYRRR